MPYLERRIEKLLADYKAGTLVLRADDTELLADLEAVAVDERGRIDLSDVFGTRTEHGQIVLEYQRQCRQAASAGIASCADD